MKNRITRFMRAALLNDQLFRLRCIDYKPMQWRPEYFEMVRADLVNLTDEFVASNDLLDSNFILTLNKTFATERFNTFLKKWILEYLYKILEIIEHYSTGNLLLAEKLELEDNPLNRFAVEKYSMKFRAKIVVRWTASPSIIMRILNLFSHQLFILYYSLKSGIKVTLKRKKYKVMREALWRLQGRGFYFHDDFLVDDAIIKKEDLLLYSRGTSRDEGRITAYKDAVNSPYGHFILSSLPISFYSFFRMILPKYCGFGVSALYKSLTSPYYTLFSSIFLIFTKHGVLYEKIFSNYNITSELGHDFHLSSHIAESIVCQNHGTKYYFVNFSDISGRWHQYGFSFLGCDQFLVWGTALAACISSDRTTVKPIGYVFKRAIREARSKRQEFLLGMGVKSNNKVVSFFDETFGGGCIMTEEHFVCLWETALNFAKKHDKCTVLVKPKIFDRHRLLSAVLKIKFLEIKYAIENMTNIHIIDSNKWSFIEVIGVSDVVVCQSMTSTSTIAIISGIEGLYLDQAHVEHVFSKLFKNKIVFDNPDRLLSMIDSILDGTESVFRFIPDNILRRYDVSGDDRGIDRIRQILAGVV